jgi:rhamnosyl/mannosyltransferase
MRVTMLNKYYYPHLGGIEFHMKDLAEGLLGRELDVAALVSNEGSRLVEDEVDGVAVRRLPRLVAYASTPIAPSMRREIKALETGDASSDIVHLHSPYPWGEVSWKGSGTSLPSVLSYHSDIVRQRVMGTAYRPLLERVLDSVDLIVAGSPNMVEHSPLLAPRAEKVRVVPYGIDVSKYAPTPARVERAEALKREHERPIVLFVGRLVYYKGANILVEAMQHVDADAVIIGSGPLESELRERVFALGMTERFTFLKPQPQEELAAWYRAADVFCLPSVARSEAFGLVQIEAHASGTPAISTDLTTGVPFANLDGVTGLTVPVGDVDALTQAIATLVGDDELRGLLGRQAFERATSDFTIPRMAQEMEAVYAEAIERHTA